MDHTLVFCDNAAIKGKENDYVLLKVSTEKILSSWKNSLYSFEWLTPEGTIKTPEDLSETEKDKRKLVEHKISQAEPLEYPVLGIGLLECVEIGAGRATLLTLSSLGHSTLHVHVLKTHTDSFDVFLAA